MKKQTQTQDWRIQVQNQFKKSTIFLILYGLLVAGVSEFVAVVIIATVAILDLMGKFDKIKIL